MRRLAKSAVLASLLTLLGALPALADPLLFPLRNQDGFPIDDDPPPVTASSWIIYDESSDSVLAEWDADTRRPMASITKIMTVLLALERGNLEEEVTISETAAGIGAQEIGLVAGEIVTMEALVKAALIRSGNDAAAAIAEQIGGSVEGFVDLMNQRATELGMTNTHFANPHGLDQPEHYSSARDMLIVAREAMAMPEFAEIARARAMVFPDTPTGSPRSATNTNRILNSYAGAIGVKTGETPNAGLTYVGVAERDGRRLFVVVFRSVGRRAHFADAIALYEWAFRNLGIQTTLTRGVSYRPTADRVNPSPLTSEAAVEAYLHVAGTGLGSNPPAPPGEEGPGEPPPVIDITRHPHPAPDSVLTTLTYWLGIVIGAYDG